jgi:TrmH family RNA methyltransferase
MKLPKKRCSVVTVSTLLALQNRATRDENQLFYAEGVRALVEATHAQIPLEALFYCPALLSYQFARRLLRRLRKQGVPCSQLTNAQYQQISRSDEPQGVCFVARQNWTNLQNATPQNCWLALDEIRTPGNLGTMIRSAEAFGAQGLVLLGDQVDPFHPTCVRASMGALFNVQFMRASLPDFLAWKMVHNCQLVGTSPHATIAHFDFRFGPRSIIWMGSERQGLSIEQQKLCDAIIQIPMSGRSDSLNVAMAASICLAEVFRQRRAAHVKLNV